MECDKVIACLESSSRQSIETLHPGPDIRPCVATMIDSAFCKGDFPDRNTAALIIASEFRRQGMERSDVERRVELWNMRNLPPLRYSEWTKAVRSAYAKEYKYSCLSPHLEPTCIGRDTCPFATHVVSKRKTYNNRLFLQLHWQRLLTNTAKSVYYLALIELERVRQVGAGGVIYAGHRMIAETAGISRRSVSKALLELKQVGLIMYEPGVPRKWEGKASQIQRIIPIPRPPRSLLLKLEGQYIAT